MSSTETRVSTAPVSPTASGNHESKPQVPPAPKALKPPAPEVAEPPTPRRKDGVAGNVADVLEALQETVNGTVDGAVAPLLDQLGLVGLLGEK